MGINATVIFDRIEKEFDAGAPGPTLHRVCRVLRSEVEHYDWVGFYLAVPDQQLLALGPFDGAPTEHVRIPYGTGVCGQAASRGETFIVQDVREETNYLACSLETRAEIVVPVFHDGVFVGELDIDSHTASPFGPEDDVLLSRIVGLTAPLVRAILPPS